MALVLIGGFIGLERLTRQGEAARSVQSAPADQGATRALGQAFVANLVTLLFAPVFNRMRLGRFPTDAVGWFGIGTTVGGCTLRFWANHTLGTFYTRTLRTTTGQQLVDNGPYRLIRHPGYLGTLLLWLSAGLAATNWLVLVTIAGLMGRAYGARILAEERMLAERFPEEYSAYASKTWRLLPGVY